MHDENKEYLSTEVRDGVKRHIDRRIPELQPDGTTIIRDPVTRKAWTTDGRQLPDGWEWTDGI